MRRRTTHFILLLAIAARCAAAQSAQLDFNFQIRPLLSDRCFRCHGPDSASRKAKLRLDQPEGAFRESKQGTPVIAPGKPDESEIIRRIFADDPDDLMPPPASNLELSASEKELLKKWIAQGAEYKPHWAFIPLKKIIPPPRAQNDASTNPVDAFIQARLDKENLKPAAEASREILIRRLAFDLTGLPPTIAEIDSFLADKSPDAYERTVEKYLSSPAYGERMARDWLDLARFADTFGYQQDMERDMSPWRDWVIRAFNDNLPYDKFLTWQLAGDLLPNATREQKLATAFNRLHRQTNEGGSIDDEFRAEYVSDRVNTVGTAMLGLTVGCAKCHDHKFDPVLQRDYYSLGAFFNSIDESGTYSHFTHAMPTPTLLLWPDDKAKLRDELALKISTAEKNLEKIAGESDAAFQSWRADGGTISAPKPSAHFTFDAVVAQTGTNGATNYFYADSVSGKNLAKLVDGPKSVPGHTGGALLFSGDNEVDCNNTGDFRRTDTFSFSLWLKPSERQDRAVVLHHSKAAMDSGSRGYELTLDHGRPAFGLIHFWPGNAVLIRAKQELPTNEWSQITVTYDGSSRAAGIRIYLGGVRLETETVRDNLYKDIIHRKEWNDLLAGKIELTLGARFRDNGFKNGAVDDLQIFDACLTASEVELISGKNPAGDGKDFFLAHGHEPFRAALADLKKLRQQENDLANDVPEIMVMRELPQPRPAFLLKRGAYDAPGEAVRRDTPASILPFPKDAPRDRLGLAQWMVDRANPLTARVVVNRIWRTHFGRGIVASEQDFGSQGKLPTHPELLDWLAGWFMDNGWDVKALHRLIATSAAYRQSSHAPKELLERDPDNTLLARGPQHRLLAEEIRDSALAASGLLVTNIGGPSVKPYQPEGLWEESGTGAKYRQDHGEKLYRRSLYTFWKRTSPPPTMLSFDAVTREVCTANRETTTTPLQALVLLNDPQFIEAARALGEKLLKQFPTDPDARIRTAMRMLVGHAPDETEMKLLRALFAEQKDIFARDAGAAEKFLSTGESKPDAALPRAEFAAMTTLVSAVMNLDEFVMER